MMKTKSFLTVSAVAIFMAIQGSDMRVLPTRAFASTRFELSQSKAPNPGPTDRPSPITVPATPTIVPDFSLGVTDVKYLSFQISPANSELGLHRDDGFHRIKIFWKQFSGCFPYTEDVRLVARLILRDGTPRVFDGKLNPAQDCRDANCFSTVAVAGSARDGIPARYEVQVIDAATFRAASLDSKTIGQFPRAPNPEIDIPPGFGPGTPGGPGSINHSVKITNVEYVGLAGSAHTLKVYSRFSNFTCFNKRPQISAPLDVSLFVKDRQSGVNHTINFSGGLKFPNDCSSTGDCLSTVRLTGNATDDRPTGIFVKIQSFVVVDARGVGTKRGEF